MPTIQDVRAALDEFHNRLPGVDKLTVSEQWHIPSSWSTTSFPNAAMPGVYFFVDAEGQVIYVGKASAGLGQRLGQEYIGLNGVCKSEKVKSATALFTIPLDPSLFFLAPAIEEFLINFLRPSGNLIGLNRLPPETV